jgi:hypothetical protein
MSAKPSLQIATMFAVLLIAAAAHRCRGDDFDDRILEKVRQRRAAEGLELKRDVTDALARSESLASSSPEKALGQLRAHLSRLRDDRLLSKEERRFLIGRVEDRVAVLAEQVAKKTGAAGIPSKPHPGGKGTGSPQVAGLGGVTAQVTPVVVPGQGFVRVSLSGTFVSPTGFPAVSLNTTVSVPDGGTAVVGGYSSLAEGRHEYGPPGLSNIPYGSRLFKNVGYGRQVRSVRVLVGVRVFSLREEDERLLSQGPAK